MPPGTTSLWVVDIRVRPIITLTIVHNITDTAVPRHIRPMDNRTLRINVPGLSGTALRESNGKKSKKMIKKEVPSVLPDS